MNSVFSKKVGKTVKNSALENLILSFFRQFISQGTNFIKTCLYLTTVLGRMMVKYASIITLIILSFTVLISYECIFESHNRKKKKKDE